ncbi:uncharacterized protein V1518DRAFT_416558 [Limtongia smithiae]|uniref:uncharacterized protein n=1 Tax=Limtongia smithiae TaxID=1125753 RepID=UPI0034CF2853
MNSSFQEPSVHMSRRPSLTLATNGVGSDTVLYSGTVRGNDFALVPKSAGPVLLQGLQALSFDVIQRIAAMLPYCDRVRMQRTSRRMREALTSGTEVNPLLNDLYARSFSARITACRGNLVTDVGDDHNRFLWPASMTSPRRRTIEPFREPRMKLVTVDNSNVNLYDSSDYDDRSDEFNGDDESDDENEKKEEVRVTVTPAQVLDDCDCHSLDNQDSVDGFDWNTAKKSKTRLPRTKMKKKSGQRYVLVPDIGDADGSCYDTDDDAMDDNGIPSVQRASLSITTSVGGIHVGTMSNMTSPLMATKIMRTSCEVPVVFEIAFFGTHSKLRCVGLRAADIYTDTRIEDGICARIRECLGKSGLLIPALRETSGVSDEKDVLMCVSPHPRPLSPRNREERAAISDAIVRRWRVLFQYGLPLCESSAMLHRFVEIHGLQVGHDFPTILESVILYFPAFASPVQTPYADQNVMGELRRQRPDISRLVAPDCLRGIDCLCPNRDGHSSAHPTQCMSIKRRFFFEDFYTIAVIDEEDTPRVSASGGIEVPFNIAQRFLEDSNGDEDQHTPMPGRRYVLHPRPRAFARNATDTSHMIPYTAGTMTLRALVHDFIAVLLEHPSAWTLSLGWPRGTAPAPTTFGNFCSYDILYTWQAARWMYARLARGAEPVWEITALAAADRSLEIARENYWKLARGLFLCGLIELRHSGSPDGRKASGGDTMYLIVTGKLAGVVIRFNVDDTLEFKVPSLVSPSLENWLQTECSLYT